MDNRSGKDSREGNLPCTLSLAHKKTKLHSITLAVIESWFDFFFWVDRPVFDFLSEVSCSSHAVLC